MEDNLGSDLATNLLIIGMHHVLGPIILPFWYLSDAGLF